MRSFLYEPFRAVSGSMEPTVPRGASVIVQKWGYGHPSTFGMTFGSSPHTAELKRGDIIAFDYPRNPAQTYLMRIVGLPGDTISYAGKRLTINGATVTGKQLPDMFDEERVAYLNRFEERTGEAAYSIVVRAEMPARQPDIGGFEHKGQCTLNEDKFECRIPPANYFVLGDSRDNSYDSRMWGFVASHMVVGKVVKIIP